MEQNVGLLNLFIINKLGVVKVHVLRWLYGMTSMDQVPNDRIL